MKKLSHPLTATLAILVLAAGSPTMAQNNPTRGRDDVQPGRSDNPRTSRGDAAGHSQPIDLTAGVYIASLDAEDRSVRRYAREKLWNSEGAELGTIRDFVVHVPSGRVRYAVVSSGGVLGMGNTLRLVPTEVLQETDDHRRVTVNIQQARFLQIPPVNTQHYVSDQFQISAPQHEQMVKQFGGPGSTGQPVIMGNEDGSPAGLIRATTLQGKTVHAGDQALGKIEHIILDLEHGTAAALLTASGGLTVTQARYLMPLNSLSYDFPNQNPIATNLTRADFDRARSSNYGMVPADRAAAPATTNEELTPTGRANPGTVVAPVDRAVPPVPSDAAIRASDPIETSAQAVRQAIQNEPDLAVENVRVSTDNNKIILRGSVRNQAIKDKLENAAKRAVPAGMVESHITVDVR